MNCRLTSKPVKTAGDSKKYCNPNTRGPRAPHEKRNDAQNYDLAIRIMLNHQVAQAR
jgi:hypothetical protein